MKFSAEDLLLYAVTDRAWTKGATIFEQTEAALEGGATCVQLREKDLCGADFLAEAVEMKKLCERFGVPLIINDNIEAALQSGADGVHIGQSDMDARRARQILGGGRILGVSANTPRDALRAQEDGADYIGAGAVFATATKPEADVVGLCELRNVCRAVSIPVVAIGGIHKGNMMELASSGVCGAALISAIFAADDIKKECAELRVIAERAFGVEREGKSN